MIGILNLLVCYCYFLSLAQGQTYRAPSADKAYYRSNGSEDDDYFWQSVPVKFNKEQNIKKSSCKTILRMTF